MCCILSVSPPSFPLGVLLGTSIFTSSGLSILVRTMLARITLLLSSFLIGACSYMLFGRVSLIEFTVGRSGMAPTDADLLILLEPAMLTPLTRGLPTLLILVREFERASFLS